MVWGGGGVAQRPPVNFFPNWAIHLKTVLGSSQKQLGLSSAQKTKNLLVQQKRNKRIDEHIKGKEPPNSNIWKLMCVAS